MENVIAALPAPVNTPVIEAPPVEQNIHARPLELTSEEFRAVNREPLVKQPYSYVPQIEVPAPPSIHESVKGKTFLAQDLGVDESSMSASVNDFILQKMQLEKLQDDANAYRSVLKALYDKFGINEHMEHVAIVETLYHNLFVKGLDESDYLVMTILAKNNARTRRQ